MKKMIFTLMMIAGLALVATTAMAKNETEVLPGNTYSYSLTNIVLTEQATATVSFTGTNSGNVTIYDEGTTDVFTNETLETTDDSFDFDVLYQNTADPLGTNDSIIVRITYNGTTSSCENSIALSIDILPPPTYTLTIAVDPTETCQERTGRGDNLADARGGETGPANTITFTVTPTITNIPTGANFEFIYDIIADLPSTINGINISPTVGVTGTPVTITTPISNHVGGSYSADQDYTLTFETTTGVGSEDIEAILVNITSNAKLTVNDGSITQGEYSAGLATGGSETATTTISAVPTMGGFVF